MNNGEAYFTNRVAMMGKVIAFKEETPEFQSFLLETQEVWPEGETYREAHEIRYYKNERHPQLEEQGLVGKLVELNGRIRIKDSSQAEYRPFIHCLDFKFCEA